MVGLPYDCLSNPLGAVRFTFEKAVASGSNPAALEGKDWGAAGVFRDFLFDNGGLCQVPMLNMSTIKWVQPNTLVHFRGMIQDMLGNEFYVGAYKDGNTWRTNKFTDSSPYPMASSSDMQIWERRLLYCVPVPGQNSWTEFSPEGAKRMYTNNLSSQREKRPWEDDATMSDVLMEQDPSHDHQASPSSKKRREDEKNFQPLSSVKTAETSSNTNSVFEAERKSFSCLVKIYDSPESDLKLNDVFEFVGIFTLDPDLNADKYDNDDIEHDFGEDALVHLPPSEVPRLHCLLHRKLAINDFLSVCPALEVKPNMVKEVREGLLGHLTAVLGNDRMTAEYMLLHILSRVHARVDTIAVGKLSLNLTCFNKQSASVFGNLLKLAIDDLIPFTHCLPLTLDYLNSASLSPKKDYDTNRLVSGVLQLAEGSHLTVDETALQAGTLNSTGVGNARVLKSLTESQKVEYDFTYYKMEMTTDVQLLILSEGKSNILPADVVLPFCPSSVGSLSEVNADMLKTWRWYLATMKSLPHSIEKNMQKVVEDDLVAARQADQSLGGQDLSRWLTMGRLVSASLGETRLKMEHWQMVKELERLRRERLQGNM